MKNKSTSLEHTEKKPQVSGWDKFVYKIVHVGLSIVCAENILTIYNTNFVSDKIHK